jgi:hypothetical protein
MTIVVNTVTTYPSFPGIKGIREELSEIIYNISPAETPVLANAGVESVNNTFFEWQTDSLASAVTNNQQVEADDISSFDAVTPTVRIGNYCNIARKTLIVGGTEEEVRKAGRDSEIAYQIAKKGMELKRDMEAGLLANIGANAGNSTTARVTGSLLAFIKTNTDKGATGVDPVWTTVPTATRTDGTQRPFTEAILKNIVQLVWVQGGNPGTLMVGAVNKQVVSTFGGVATRTYYMSQEVTAAIIGAADVYVSDFGVITVVPNRFQRSRDAFLLDWNLLSIGYLRTFRQIPLAKTGDAEKRMLLCEYGLKIKQEAGLALAADLS